MSTTQSTSRPTRNFESFYKECASYPEIPKFRRFGAQWTKKLLDDVAELVKREQRLNEAISRKRSYAGGSHLTFLGCPRRLLKDDDEIDRGIKSEWEAYEKLLRTYAQDLCLYSKLFLLPDHVPYFSKRLNGYKELFDGDYFGPTDEEGAAAEYQNVDARDFVAVVGENRSDALTSFLTAHIDWIDKQILQRIRALLGLKRRTYAEGSSGVEHATIVKIIDALACIFVPFLLTSTMFALASTRPLMVRIAIVGAFGLAFSISAKLISGNMSRGEIFSFSAAFFAVASVFVSTTNDSVSNPS